MFSAASVTDRAQGQSDALTKPLGILFAPPHFFRHAEINCTSARTACPAVTGKWALSSFQSAAGRAREKGAPPDPPPRLPASAVCGFSDKEPQ